MIIYNNILEKLKKAGYNTFRLRKEQLLSESVIQSIRKNKAITTTTLNTICRLLDCQPADILCYVKDDSMEEEVQSNILKEYENGG